MVFAGCQPGSGLPFQKRTPFGAVEEGKLPAWARESRGGL